MSVQTQRPARLHCIRCGGLMLRFEEYYGPELRCALCGRSPRGGGMSDLEFQGPYPMEALNGTPFDGYVITLAPAPDGGEYRIARYAHVAADRHAIRTDNGHDFTGATFEAVKDQLASWLQVMFGVTVTRVVTVPPDPAIAQMRPYPLEDQG
ncbi:MAG: hypothetical protein F4X54_07395 [Chloroflexi bacterium]|nr:hypothetical protein [Chloroflexota bacterium]